MKLLFIHGEEKLKIDNASNYYTGGSYSMKTWKKYLRMTSDISVIFRKDKQSYPVHYAKSKFNFFDKNILKFIEVKNTKGSIIDFLNPKIYHYNKIVLEDSIIKSDLIIIRLPSSIGNRALEISKKNNKKYIVEVVGCPFDTLWNHSIRGKIFALPEMIKLKKAVKNSKNVIYVTNDFLQSRYPTKYKSYSCSDVDLMEIDYNFKIKKNIKTITTIGTIDVKYKGHADVFASLKELKKNGILLKYNIIGNGDNKRLKKLSKKYKISDQVNFTGAIPHEEIFKMLVETDIYIHPSKTEGLCRAIIEAMSVGCPCIVSDAGGNPELIHKEMVYKKGDIKQLTNLISNIILNHDILKKHSTLNYKKSLEFSNAFLENKINQIYEDIFKGWESE